IIYIDDPKGALSHGFFDGMCSKADHARDDEKGTAILPGNLHVGDDPRNYAINIGGQVQFGCDRFDEREMKSGNFPFFCLGDERECSRITIVPRMSETRDALLPLSKTTDDLFAGRA